ncbi:MAG: sigma-70 family RNA polymerase sigma factor [Verrucomicrobiales bacterium]|nr:sigma-70 family RNA polymerase sigma factor [Verrucomicrobiales bacterium]
MTATAKAKAKPSHNKPGRVLEPSRWDELYREYLIRFALQRVSDFGTAEDLVQDTFLSAWNGRKNFRGACHERTWLTGVLRNKIIDHYRKTGRRPSVLTTDLDGVFDDDGGQIAWIDRRPDERTDLQPVASAERHEFMDDLDEAVEQLPETMGQAFRMREMQGFSTEEITRALNISKGNLWVLIHRAKQMLSEQLRGNWFGNGDFGGPAPAAAA